MRKQFKTVDKSLTPTKNKTPINKPMEVYKLERTLSIVKPDGVTKNLIGEVLGRFEKKGLKIIALKMVKLSKAAMGTIRKDFALNIERNIAHGSDSPESASFEIKYFFNALEIHE